MERHSAPGPAGAALPATAGAALPATATAPELRVSDAEREVVTRQLRHHTAEGRLSLDELGDRLGEAYAARTGSELKAALRDLPVLAPEALPPTEVELAKARRDLRGAIGVYLAVNAVLVVVWAVTGPGFFWPLWPLLGWGFSLSRQAQHLRDGRPWHGCGRSGGRQHAGSHGTSARHPGARVHSMRAWPPSDSTHSASA